jgi:hypothetical protein
MLDFLISSTEQSSLQKRQCFFSKGILQIAEVQKKQIQQIHTINVYFQIAEVSHDMTKE